MGNILRLSNAVLTLAPQEKREISVALDSVKTENLEEYFEVVV